MASSLTLYTAAFSSNGRKTVALARQLGLHPKIVEVNVYRGEGRRADFLALNPFGKVPTLVDGELCLWESNAILIYLAEAHGGFRLWSAEPRLRAELARWLFWESAHWQPVLTQVLGQHAGHIMVPAFVTEPTAAPAWDAPALVPLLSHLEQRLNEQPYLAGSEPTLADFSVVAMTIYFRRLGFPFERYPALTAWYTRMHALESWKSTSTEPWVTG